MGSFEKFQKCNFSEICTFFLFHVKKLHTRTKNGETTEINPANRKITLKELIAMFLQCFWATCKVSAQQCS